jgi:PDZ domain-containing secreted protein
MNNASIARRWTAARTRKGIPLKLAAHDAANRAAAEVILGDVEKYGGPSAGLVLWAQHIVQRLGEESPTQESNDRQPRLFGGQQ